MKKEKLILILLLFISNLAFSQDGISWGFEVKFKVNSSNVKKRINVNKLEFFVNEPHPCENPNPKEKREVVKYDSIDKEYCINLHYISVGGASQVHYVQCPEIYIKAVLEETKKVKEVFLSVYFERAKGSHQKYDLGSIDIDDFLLYEIIEVTADKSIQKRRKIDKLISIPII